MTTESVTSRLLIERAARLMGTEVSVHLAAEPAQAAAAQASAAACLAWLAEVDARLSRFRPESELCRLNRAGGRWFPASALLFAAVERAVTAAHESDGLFDPTLLPQLEALGYDRDFALIAHREVAELAPPAAPPIDAPPTATPPVAAGGWRAIALDARRQRIRLPAGVRLDLGGIAKGWAADVALAAFCGGYAGAMVNVGGDLALRGGPQPGRGWSVGIRDPREELNPGARTQVATITLSRGGLATSGALRRWWLRDGARQHHLLDPRTGRPTRVWIAGTDECEPPAHLAPVGEESPLLATATALAPTAAQAEVAAKVALLRGYPRALEHLDAAEGARRVAGDPGAAAEPPLALLLTFGTGAVRLSANMREYLATWGTEGAPVPLSLRIPPALREGALDTAGTAEAGTAEAGTEGKTQ